MCKDHKDCELLIKVQPNENGEWDLLFTGQHCKHNSFEYVKLTFNIVIHIYIYIICTFITASAQVIAPKRGIQESVKKSVMEMCDLGMAPARIRMQLLKIMFLRIFCQKDNRSGYFLI